MSRTLLVGYGIDPSGPYLAVDTSEGETGWQRKRVYIRGTTLTLRRLKARFCVGPYNLDTLESIPCPHRSRIAERAVRCAACEYACGFNPAFYNAPLDRLSPQQRRYNERPHIVYIACFGTDAFKVGISTKDRCIDRLREQGARLARVAFAAQNAYVARSLELRISQHFGLPETMRHERKLVLLTEPFDSDRATEQLNDLIQRMTRDLELVALDNQTQCFMRDYLDSATLGPTLVDLSSVPPLCISGRALGIVGDILISEQGPGQFALPLRQVLGHLVRIEDGEEINKAPAPALQTELFPPLVTARPRPL